MLPKGAPTYSREVDRATAFVAIELLNSWVQFSRSLYLSSCRGARDSSGARIRCDKVVYRDDNESLRIASNLFRTSPLALGHRMTQRDELNWLEPVNLLKALDHVGASNYGTVGAALSLQSRSLRDLPSVRNFFGHRGHDTARKVLGVHGVIQHYSVRAVSHPTEFCLAHELGVPRSVLGTWLEEIAIVQEFACS